MSRVTVALDIWMYDLAAAARALRRSSGFTAAVLSSLALGVGANIATFTVLDRVLFQTPPGVSDADRIRRLYIQQAHDPSLHVPEFSFPALMELSDAAKGMARIEGYETRFDRLIEGGSIGVNVAYVTSGYFEMLGLRPLRGRFFGFDENRPGDPRRVAVLSHRLWRRLFGESASVIGQSFRIDSLTYLVVGITPEDFEGVDMEAVGVWAPLAARPAFEEPLPLLERSTHSIHLLARLEGDADGTLLSDFLTAAYTRTNKPDPWFDSFGRIVAVPLLQARGPFIRGSHNQQNLLLARRLAMVGLIVLLATVANVASLLLMRTIRRRHESAVRAALGASPARLISQIVAENLLLVAAAGVLAGLVGWWGGNVLRNAMVLNIRWSVTPFPQRVVFAAALLVTISAFVAALVPALLAARAKALQALRGDDRSGDYLGPRFRAAVLATQAALGLALLTCGGAFLESLRRAATIDQGFDRDRLISIDATGRRLLPGAASEAVAQIRRLPSVVSVANALADLRSGQSFAVRSDRSTPVENEPLSANFVDSAYFATTGLRLLHGRGIVPSDIQGSERVGVLSESIAELLWPDGNAMGKCLFEPDSATCIRIVGVVRDVRWNVRAAPAVNLFLPLAQSGWGQGHYFVVRTDRRASIGTTIAAVDRVLADVLPRSGRRPHVQSVNERLATLTRPWQAAATLFSLYALLAVIATAFGIYASIHYEMVQRARELAIRVVMGAEARNILSTVIATAARPLGVGLILGLILVVNGGRVIAPFLFQVSPHHPILLAIALSAIALAALIAALIPARRITRIDPAVLLRSD